MPSILSESTQVKQTESVKGYRGTFAILIILFFMWGFITCLNDILIPYLRGVFELSYFQSMLVQFAFFGAYFVGSVIYFIVSLLLGDPVSKMGYKNGIVLGLVISALGCFLFIPAAAFLVYGFFLTALFCLGLGLTILQIAANPYVSILGSPKTASSRLNLAQGFNSFGYTIAPVVGGYLIFSFIGGEGVLGADAVKVPYLGLGLLFLLVALVIKLFPFPMVTNDQSIEKGSGALGHRHLVLGMVAIFMYVGGEVTIGSLLVNLFGLPEIAGLDEAEASTFLSFFWGGAMIGRFLGAISLRGVVNSRNTGLMIIVAILSFLVIYGVNFFNTGISFNEISPFILFILLNLIALKLGNSNPQRTLAIFSGIVILLLLIVIFSTGKVAFWCAIAIGLFNSIMWSNVFILAIAGLGKYTSQASSLLVMMIVGGALVPLAHGAFADVVGVQKSYALPILCYLFLGYYGLSGYKPRKQPLQTIWKNEVQEYKGDQ